MLAFPSNHYKVLDGLIKAAVLFSAYNIILYILNYNIILSNLQLFRLYIVINLSL